MQYVVTRAEKRSPIISGFEEKDICGFASTKEEAVKLAEEFALRPQGRVAEYPYRIYRCVCVGVTDIEGKILSVGEP